PAETFSSSVRLMTTRSYSGLMLIAAHIFLVGLPIAFIARRRDRARAQKFAA
ncbi:TPA: hypothetical protein OHO73_005116, partial [Escherichia coli]|nr:hypothetical protein [Escherichia coli]HCQ2785403.1 hypothetical protein [Escherichia coli]HDI6021078.1 hypothetical protein [Escherichia coli]